MMILILLALSLLGQAQQNSVMTLVVEHSLHIESVKAEVVIKNGQIVSSNCEKLGQEEGMPKYDLQLNSINGNYFCVPKTDKKIIYREKKLKFDFELNAENIRRELAKYTHGIESTNDFAQTTMGSHPTIPQPQCSVNSTGSVDLESCVCNSNNGDIYSFNQATKTCESDKNIIGLFLAHCSSQWDGVMGLMEFIGHDTLEFSNELLAMCGEKSYVRYYVPNNDLIYKILYFSYMKHMLVPQISEKLENTKLLITQEELANYSAWASSAADILESNLKLPSYSAPLSRMIESVRSFSENLASGSILTDTVVVEK